MVVSRSAGTSLPRVLGVLIARNEWPLLGLSITHALVNHVDEMIVVDHASTDQTQAGLAALQKRWGKKIQVLHMCEGVFHHEETNLLLKTMYEKRNFDWVYPIDADEFLITQENLSLKQILLQVPANYEVVRYQLHNFVAPANFVENDFQRYEELCEKAVVTPNFVMTHEDFVDSIVQGGLNFFEVPFPSKIIFRLPLDLWPESGSHAIIGMDENKEFKINEELTFVAHLPFLTRERLIRRAERGKTLVNSGYPRNRGWQSQVVNYMQAQGRLDEYWKRNSIPIDTSNAELSLPKTIKDDRLAPVLSAAVAEFLPTLEILDSYNLNQEMNCKSEVTITQSIEALRKMSLHKQSKLSNVQTHIHNLDNRILALQAEREELFNSLSWRLTRFLRIGHGKLRKVSFRRNHR